MIDLDNVMAEVAANTYQEGIDDLHGGQNQYQVLDAGLPVDLAIDMGNIKKDKPITNKHQYGAFSATYYLMKNV